MRRDVALVMALFIFVASVGSQRLAAASSPSGWVADYTTATARAETQKKMLLIVFRESDEDPAFARLESAIERNPAMRRRLETHYVRACLPWDVEIRIDGRPVRLLSHPAFASLDQKPGLAVLDFAHAGANYFGGVVSTLPFTTEDNLSSRVLSILLDLPPGTPKARAARFARKVARAKRWSSVAWHTNYAEAMAQAEREGRMLVILFCAAGDAARCNSLAGNVLNDPVVRARLAECVAVRLPLDAVIRASGKEVRLIDQPAFAEMLGREGVAVLDFVHRKNDFYGTVVSTFPTLDGRPYSVEHVRAMLDLPPGTLTQRTLIYAVRTHPERPASTDGLLLRDLAREASSHSAYQARIRLQGHHQWNMRFQRIGLLLPGGGTPSEVCAESWPGEGLLAAAIDCVQCWRSSSGHWSKVRARHRFFGYDMKRGANGIWYATGIFGEG